MDASTEPLRPPRSHSRARTVLRWTGIALGSIVVVLLVVLALLDWNMLKHPIERFASAKSGRTVTIAGPLEVHPWSWTPTVIVNQLTVGNPPWEAARPMIQVERLQVQLKLLPLLKGDVILPRVELRRPEVYLHSDKSGRANWTFESTRPSNAPAPEPTKLPVIRDFLIESGTLVLKDDVRKLSVEGTVQAHEKPSQEDATPFRIAGKGTLNDQPFSMQIAGGPLVNLDPDHPYPFDMALSAGDIRVTSKGSVRKPFNLGKLDFTVQASGRDLAELYYLTQLALPNTPPFKLSAHIQRDDSQVKVTDIAGQVGQSDLSGTLTVDASKKRPTITGDLVSKKLRLADLAASLGTKPKSGDSLDADATPQTAAKEKAKDKKAAKSPPASPNDRLFPVARLQVDRVRAMDADVRYRAQSIEAGTVPLKEVSFRVKLDDGVLALDPFAFEMPQGRLTGTAQIDARKTLPYTRLDVRMKNIQLDQLKGKAPDAKPPLGGVMQARAVLQGPGDSVHDLMANANGTLTVILPHGEVRAALAELTGINVARGVGLLLRGDEERADIRCGVAQFDVQRGTARAQNVVFDTENVRITGRGEIRFGPEELDLEIKGQPKKLRLARLRTPVEVNGHLLKPSIGVDVSSTVKQGAVAGALAAVVAPLAAVLAFVDPGLAKDENCSALLAAAEAAPGAAPLKKDVARDVAASKANSDRH